MSTINKLYIFSFFNWKILLKALNPNSSCNSWLIIFAMVKVPVYWQVLNVLPTDKSITVGYPVIFTSFQGLKNLGLLSFNEKFRFEFPVKNGTAISRLSGKEDNRTRYTEILGNIFSQNFRSIWIYSRNFSNFRVEWFAYRKFNNFRISGNFPRTLTYHLSKLRNFGNFWLNGKRPLVYLVNHWNSISAPVT